MTYSRYGRGLSPRRRQRTLFPWIIGIGTVLVLVVVGALIAWNISISVGNPQTLTCTVNDKDRTSVSDGDGGSHSDMRVYTDQCGVLQVRDVTFRVYNSSDIYNQIKVGQTYTFHTIGQRIPIFSAFPTITEVN